MTDGEGTNQTLAHTVVRSIQQKGDDSVPRAICGSHVIHLRPYRKPFPRQPHVTVPSRFAETVDSSPHRSAEEAVPRQQPCEFATDSQTSKLRVFVDLKIRDEHGRFRVNYFVAASK